MFDDGKVRAAEMALLTAMIEIVAIGLFATTVLLWAVILTGGLPL